MLTVLKCLLNSYHSLLQLNFLQPPSQNTPPSCHTKIADWLKRCQSIAIAELRSREQNKSLPRHPPKVSWRAGCFAPIGMPADSRRGVTATLRTGKALTLNGLSLAGSANGLLSNADMSRRLRAVLSSLKHQTNNRLSAGVCLT